MPTFAQILTHARTGDMMREVKARAHGRIARCADYERVLALPERPSVTPEQRELLSASLRKREYGIDQLGQPRRNELRLLQAIALRELYEMPGVFAPITTGGGKTLPSLLAATLLQSKRAVLVVPARLRDKTRRAFVDLLADWHVSMPTLLSYSEISVPSKPHRLRECEPDLLILDEAHKAKNEDASCTRRIKRTIEQCTPRVLVMSGSLITEELMHAWQFAVWALRQWAPVPLVEATARRWAEAVDRDVGALHRVGAGILDDLPGDPTTGEQGFWPHFRSRRGVVPVVSGTGDDVCHQALTISVWQPTLPKRLQDLIEQTIVTRMRPDGELLQDLDIPDVLHDESHGFYSIWDPMPPDSWRLPRRAWNGYVRDVLDLKLDHFDSPATIAIALDHPESPQPPDADAGRKLLALWRQVEPTFVPNPVPVWVDDSPVRELAERIKSQPGTLCWVKQTAVGERLQQYGVRYFPGGTDPERDAIVRRGVGEPIALQYQAFAEGFNLQHGWWRAIYSHLSKQQTTWQQTLARIHRSGQTRDCEAEVRIAIAAHGNALSSAYAAALGTARSSAAGHKLVDATWI